MTSGHSLILQFKKEHWLLLQLSSIIISMLCYSVVVYVFLARNPLDKAGYKPNVKFEYVDDSGRLLDQKGVSMCVPSNSMLERHSH